ncbi:MAG: TonB-dependent receptor [Nibricoccus sp.]
MSSFHRLVLTSALLAFLSPMCAAAEETKSPKPPEAGDKSLPLVLDRYTVQASQDEVATWPEEKPDVFPFDRVGVFSELEAEQKPDQGAAMLSDELAVLPDPRQMEFVSISGGSTPRGFTAPRLRNGLTQLGFPEQIVGGRRDLLTGFMAVLYGRTAPGGIVNLISRRPTPKMSWQLDVTASDFPAFFVQAERSELLITKKLNGRILGSMSEQDGPEDFARRRDATGTASLRYSPDKYTVIFWEVEIARTKTIPSGGLPYTREVSGGPIGAPCIALADFNTNGPDAWARRTSRSTSIWAERKLTRGWYLRGGAQYWDRTQRELRFSTGPYVLSTGIFDGTREPQYNDRTDRTVGAQLEADIPWKGRRFDQRWLVGVEGSQAVTGRIRRALEKTDRDALPSGVLHLDPASPDYSTPTYSEATYSRVLTLRDEDANYVGVFLSDRISWARGKHGATFGIRQDWVDASIEDRLPGTKIPHATSSVGKTTYHAGWVGQNARGLAVFVNHSTAFQPQRRVDARTGRIQGNESTSGIETGLRWLTPNKKLLLTTAVYRLWNKNITRLNPAYDDPILDPEHTKPQLVSSGEEQFTGFELSARYNVTRKLTADARAAWLEATTTSSPDLPEEVGRQLPRTPKLTGSSSLTWRTDPSGLRWQHGCGFAWIGEQVAVYKSPTRQLWRNSSYGIVGLNSSYTWQQGKRIRHSVGVSVRNALNRNLVAAAGRVGGQRTIEGRYSARF